jgi:lycopene cyclase domain-containing protein
MASMFLIWDIWFTEVGVWGFNPDYLVGSFLFGLPLEEWLFFLCIPYAFMFLYDQFLVLNIKNVLRPVERYLNYFMIGVSAALLLAGFGNLYTTTVTVLVILLLILLEIVKPDNKGIFYMCYVIILIPFTIINGVLTGYATEQPVVWYNNAENLSTRFFTIPIEDFLYYFLMYGMCYLIYEGIKKGRQKTA